MGALTSAEPPHPMSPISPGSFRSNERYFAGRPGLLNQAAAQAAVVDDPSSASCPQQFSLLISFDLLTIPPPATFSPFRHGRFSTLHHRRDLPRLSPGQTLQVGGTFRHAVKGSDILGSLPDRLGRIEFTFVADWSFVSGCPPPFLLETQLPLSTTGR
jgi:hypothetical protein